METIFWKKLKALCEERQTTPSGVCKALGLSTGSPPEWKRGRMPGPAIREKIASFFGVSPDYFVVETEKAPEPEESKPLSREQIKFALFGEDAPSIPEEKLDEVLRYAEIIKHM